MYADLGWFHVKLYTYLRLNNIFFNKKTLDSIGHWMCTDLFTFKTEYR